MAISKAKVALIGGGQIGGVLVQLIAKRNLADVVLFDIVENLPQGKTLDIAEAASADKFDTQLLGSNDYKDIEGADVCIVTAGLPRKPGMSRDDLLSVNAGIIKDVASNIKKYAPDSIVIVVSNPLDAMVTLMKEITGFPTNRVFGQAGVLDSSRFATFIAWELGVSVKNVNALVLGGHGDTMVPLVRYANVNGVPVMEMLTKKYNSADKAKEVMATLVKRTAGAGGEVVELLKTGSAFYSPAASCLVMLEAILNDEKSLQPTCAYLQGEYGVDGYYVGIPAILGKDGVEKIVELDLNEEEKKMFDHSVGAVKTLVEDLKRLNFI